VNNDEDLDRAMDLIRISHAHFAGKLFRELEQQ